VLQFVSDSQLLLFMIDLACWVLGVVVVVVVVFCIKVITALSVSVSESVSVLVLVLSSVGGCVGVLSFVVLLAVQT